MAKAMIAVFWLVMQNFQIVQRLKKGTLSFLSLGISRAKDFARHRQLSKRTRRHRHRNHTSNVERIFVPAGRPIRTDFYKNVERCPDSHSTFIRSVAMGRRFQTVVCEPASVRSPTSSKIWLRRL